MRYADELAQRKIDELEDKLASAQLMAQLSDVAAAEHEEYLRSQIRGTRANLIEAEVRRLEAVVEKTRRRITKLQKTLSQ